tara:strand:- start:75 stop:527 length:453 start_codon:yes stop_codon:yes gene_type:complete
MPILGPIMVIVYYLLSLLYKSIELISKIIINTIIKLKIILKERRRAKSFNKAINLERVKQERQKAINLERVKQERQKANEYKKLVNLIEKKLPIGNESFNPSRQKGVNNNPSKQKKNKKQLNTKKNFCNKCGAVFEEGSYKCSYCGIEQE